MPTSAPALATAQTASQNTRLRKQQKTGRIDRAEAYEPPPRGTQHEGEELTFARDSDTAAEDEKESAHSSTSARKAEDRREIEGNNALLIAQNRKEDEEAEQLRKQLANTQRVVDEMVKNGEERSATALRIGVAQRATGARGNAQQPHPHQQRSQPGSMASQPSSAQPRIAQAEALAQDRQANKDAKALLPPVLEYKKALVQEGKDAVKGFLFALKKMFQVAIIPESDAARRIEEASLYSDVDLDEWWNAHKEDPPRAARVEQQPTCADFVDTLYKQFVPIVEQSIAARGAVDGHQISRKRVDGGLSPTRIISQAARGHKGPRW
jgi:hypothetical protein